MLLLFFAYDLDVVIRFIKNIEFCKKRKGWGYTTVGSSHQILHTIYIIQVSALNIHFLLHYSLTLVGLLSPLRIYCLVMSPPNICTIIEYPQFGSYIFVITTVVMTSVHAPTVYSPQTQIFIFDRDLLEAYSQSSQLSERNKFDFII